MNRKGRAVGVHYSAILLNPVSSLIITIFLISLVVRLIGIDHGFPYIYHPDEPTIVRSALSVRLNSNPKHFDWPHLYVYLNYFAYMAFAKVRALVPFQMPPIIYNEELIFYLITRIFSAFLGALTIIPIYLWVKKIVSRRAGILSAALLALTPLHVRNSHYTLIDVPMLFFLSWSLYFSTFSPVLSGLFLGLSTSIKYNGILGGMFIGLYLLSQRSKSLIQRIRDIAKLGIFTILGFLAGTPYALLDYKTFLRTDGPQGALWQFTNVGKVGLESHLVQFSSTVSSKLPSNLGYGMMLLILGGLGILIYQIVMKRRPNIAIGFVALTAVYLTFYVSGLAKNRSHYYMFIYPNFLLLAGWAFSVLLDKVRRPIYRTVFILLIFLPSLILSVTNIVDLKTRTSPYIYGGDMDAGVKIN